ncbi:hydroxymethylglutaryl-CoA lyase [Marinobacter sp.]|uniref:hydroxymethylglutaryl-CoA lyase n=1 Tax=Marinobacter sp. TaxID=50741 RepID=UPI003A8F3816
MTTHQPRTIELVEVAPRDGFQSISSPLPTADKIRVIQALVDAGLHRIEIGSFVSPKAVPQMADIGDIVAEFIGREGLRLSALVPNLRGAELALAKGVRELVYVVSVSETHNSKNVRQSVSQSLDGLKAIADKVRESDSNGFLRLDLGTSFDCPYEGRIGWEQVSRVLEQAIEVTDGLRLEVAFCDTTGRANPYQVQQTFRQIRQRIGGDAITWAFHGHNTFGMGVANALFAIQEGVTVLDASSAGLGGCPFAPGATGNTATEDLLFALNEGGVETGVDMARLLEAADLIAGLPGGHTASSLRQVPRARAVA